MLQGLQQRCRGGRRRGLGTFSREELGGTSLQPFST